jgi:hypothetical protein
MIWLLHSRSLTIESTQSFARCADQFSKPIYHQVVQTGITKRVYIISAASSETRTVCEGKKREEWSYGVPSVFCLLFFISKRKERMN